MATHELTIGTVSSVHSDAAALGQDVLAVGHMPSINFGPTSEVEEILQNVRCVIATVKGSVPLDRDLGLDPEHLDMPLEVARARFASELILGVAKYEPRAAVTNIDWEATINGTLAAKVKVNIDEQYE